MTRLITASLRRMGAYDLGDEHQDICQDVVWALVRAVREGRAPDPERERAYVVSVVRNHFVTWLRRRGPRAHGSVVGTDPDAHAIESAVVSVRGERRDAESSDVRLAARRALARLPYEWQSLLVAHYVEGCTIDMLVATDGTSRATLNRELKRARDAFRAALLDDGGVVSDGTDVRVGKDTGAVSHAPSATRVRERAASPFADEDERR